MVDDVAVGIERCTDTTRRAEVQKTSALVRVPSGNSQRVSDLRRRVTVSGWEFDGLGAADCAANEQPIDFGLKKWRRRRI